MTTTSNTISSTSNNIINTGISSNTLTSTGTNPYIYGTPIDSLKQPGVTLTDCSIVYDSKFSDGLTFQHEVAVIKVTRNNEGSIIKSKMVKVFWVETKTQGSIDYAASKDLEVSELEPEDIIIKTLRTIRL